MRTRLALPSARFPKNRELCTATRTFSSAGSFANTAAIWSERTTPRRTSSAGRGRAWPHRARRALEPAAMPVRTHRNTGCSSQLELIDRPSRCV